jgi:hypothetical protein
MNTDSEKAGAQAPCLLCGRPAGEHSRDTADVCNCYLAGETDAHKRCAICGFVIDTKYEATKPTIEYGSAGRTKRATETWNHIERLLTEECGLPPDEGLAYQRSNCINAISNDGGEIESLRKALDAARYALRAIVENRNNRNWRRPEMVCEAERGLSNSIPPKARG